MRIHPTEARSHQTVRFVLMAILAVATVAILRDGTTQALAAAECQYGPYSACPKAKPTLRLNVPSSVGIGIVSSPQAVLENGDGPTGPLFVRLHRPGEDCADPSQPPFWVGSITVNGNGIYSPSPFGPPPFDRLGTWKWSATYVGDDRNELVSTVCGAFTTDVTKRTTGFALSHPLTVPVGGLATVFGSAFVYQPTAAVTLRLYDPGDPTCSRTAALTRTLATPFFTETIGPLGTAGRWRIVLSYPGDVNNSSTTTPCDQFSFQVTRATAGLTGFVSSPAVVIGETVSAGASLTGYRPTGSLTVHFFAPTDPTCARAVQTQTLAVTGNGSYGITWTPASAGTWSVTASYSGDDANTAAALACGSHRIDVAKASPRLTLAADPTTASEKDVLHARVTVDDAYRPTGRVRFRLFGPTDAACAGTAAHVEETAIVGGVATTTAGYEVPKQQSGTWNWTATYDGDENNVSRATVCGAAPVTVVASGADPQRERLVFASGTDWETYSDYPSSVGGGAPPASYGTAQKVCLSAVGCPPGATDYGSPFGGAWTSDLASILGAAWIWRPGITGTTPNADFDQAVFSARVVLAGRPADGWIEIAADDVAEIRVNGLVVGSIGQAGPAYGTLTRFDLTPFLKPGANTIAVLARNGPWCGSCPFSQNPAGVVFGGAIEVG